MKRLIEICFVLCCLGFIFTYAKTGSFTKSNLFKQEKNISEELETIIEDNQLENFLFHSGENAICVYEGITSFEIKAHTFAIYKETVEKDIIFENILFIERGTGDIYTWGGEELEKLVLIDSFDMDEFEAADISIKNTGMDMACERTEIEMAMDKVMAVLLRNGSHGLKLIYDGATDLINRNYFQFSSFEDFEDHIHRDHHYYLDMESGNLYEGAENNPFLRTELYYIGNIKE